MRVEQFTKTLVAGIAAWALPATAFCQTAKVRGWLDSLASESFKERMEAQQHLVEWGKSSPVPALDILFREFDAAGDPEVRIRLRESLRELVIARHLKENGEGYVGIQMNEMNLAVPGDKIPRAGVQVVDVKADTPASRAGLLAGDVIVSLDGLRWTGPGAKEAFAQAVKKFKPGEIVALEVFRNDKLVKIPVTLGTRPLGLPEAQGLLWANGLGAPMPDLAEFEEKARESIFKEWLDQKRSSKKLP